MPQDHTLTVYLLCLFHNPADPAALAIEHGLRLASNLCDSVQFPCLSDVCA